MVRDKRSRTSPAWVKGQKWLAVLGPRRTGFEENIRAMLWESEVTATLLNQTFRILPLSGKIFWEARANESLVEAVEQMLAAAAEAESFAVPSALNILALAVEPFQE